MHRLSGRLHRHTLLTVLPVLLLLLVIALAAGAPARTRGTDAEAGAMMDRAEQFLRRHGAAAAVGAFADREGVFIDRDLYPMLLDREGVMVAHGWTPALIGSSLLDLRDVDGKLFMKEALEGVERQGRADVTYQWLDPLSGQITRKTLHARRLELGGEPYALAVGVYR
ncbi:cache domain-containing protein [Azospirillum agricola]|uniref:cache domain-containing protein n=1 Tax=Azospirillum agricola TaxID=1720247 RepID=UPI000A0EF3BB|nr:cache domain-containing protein [Azospirillum agricola]SMH58213.1 Cache domain [Azospirillum lipoferum]